MQESNIIVFVSQNQFVPDTLFKGAIVVRKDFSFEPPSYFEQKMREIIEGLKLTILGTLFSPTGDSFTGCIQLLESGVDVHTWPEVRQVQLLVHLCDYTTNNQQLTIDLGFKLAELFGADPDSSQFSIHRTEADGMDNLQRLKMPIPAGFP